jgi:hypothetical protein
MAERSPFDDLLDVASRLTALMERENAHLAKHEPAGVAALQDEKLALTRAYTTRVHDIQRDPAKLAAITGAVRDEMRKAFAKFDEVARRNELALKAARTVNERVLKAIVEAANAQQPRVSGYSRTGATAKPYGSAARVAVAPPVAFNRSA